MKKNLTNIEKVKQLINASVFERVELVNYGVQVYNVSDSEYNNIVAAEKRGGRYYFVDVEGASFLISRINNAEFYCGEFIETLEGENKVCETYVEVIKEMNGKPAVIKSNYANKVRRFAESQGLSIHYVSGSVRTEVYTGEVFECWALDQTTDNGLRTAEILRDIETLTETEAREKYNAEELAQAETLGRAESAEPETVAEPEAVAPVRRINWEKVNEIFGSVLTMALIIFLLLLGGVFLFLMPEVIARLWNECGALAFTGWTSFLVGADLYLIWFALFLIREMYGVPLPAFFHI